VLCLTAVPLPPDKNPFAAELNNNKKMCTVWVGSLHGVAFIPRYADGGQTANTQHTDLMIQLPLLAEGGKEVCSASNRVCVLSECVWSRASVHHWPGLCPRADVTKRIHFLASDKAQPRSWLVCAQGPLPDTEKVAEESPVKTIDSSTYWGNAKSSQAKTPAPHLDHEASFFYHSVPRKSNWGHLHGQGMSRTL
jgi:hypothetical protein